MTMPGAEPPSAIDWQNLVSAGRDLLTPRTTGSTPTDEHVRRAVSSAYYALFHALASSNADALIGAPHDPATAAAWSRIYRALDHGTARRELQRYRHEFSSGAQAFVDAFQEIQNQRHAADYNHNDTFTSQQAEIWLARVEAIITDYLQSDRSERAYIAALTLVRGR